MRPIWNGSIGFGLIHIPVRVTSALATEQVGFSLVHREDEEPIHYRKICARGHEVAAGEVVRAVNLNGHLMTVTPKDLRDAGARKSRCMDIAAFIDPAEVDPIYYDTPYHLQVEPSGEAAYALLCEALRKSAKVALVRYVFRSHESIGLIVPRGRRLLLCQLRYLSQIRQESPAAPEVKVPKSELAMALELVAKMTHQFKPEDYRDTYQEDLKKVLAAKAAGQKISSHAPKPVPTPVADLISILKKSLNQHTTQNYVAAAAAHGRETKALPKEKIGIQDKARRAPRSPRRVAATKRHS